MSKENLFEKTLKRLAFLGWRPERVLDIGAYHGLWTNDLVRLFPHLKQDHSSVTMIEAIDYPALKEHWFGSHIAILSDNIGECDWYEGRNTGDSMFKEQTGWYAGVKPVKRQTTTLDHLWETGVLGDVPYDFVKIDCQGAEIPILKGGQTVMEHVQVVLLEVPFAGEYNAGAPDFYETMAYMKSIGFNVFGITEMHELEGFLIQIDVLFVRKENMIWDMLKGKIRKIGGIYL